MAITFYWRCEGTTLAAPDDLPGADTSATASGSPAINGTAALIGSNGILINTSDEYYALNSESAVVNADAGAIGFYLRIQTFATTAGIIKLSTHSTLASNYVMVYMNDTTNNHLRFNLRNSTEGSQNFDSTTALSNDVTYFVIFKWDNAANDRRCEIYDSAGVEVGSTENLATSWTSPLTSFPVTNGMQFGEMNSFSAAYYLDNIFIGTAWADGDTIYANRNITSYGGGPAAIDMPAVAGDYTATGVATVLRVGATTWLRYAK